MEEQAAMMMVTMIGKSTETSVRVAAKSTEALVRLAAMLASMWKKSTAKGQVRMARLLESGGELSAIAMNRENFEKFRALAEKQSVMYHAMRREDTDSFLITLRMEDMQRVKTAFDFYTEMPEELAEKRENVQKDESAFDVAGRPEDEEEFARRKEETLKKDGNVDIEAWRKHAAPGEKLPKNAALCLAATDDMLRKLEQERKTEKLNEAKVVGELKERKRNSIGQKTPGKTRGIGEAAR